MINLSEELEEHLAKHIMYNSGKLEGIDQTKEEIVLNMYKENYKLEEISKITNLSIDNIQEIIDKNK